MPMIPSYNGGVPSVNQTVAGFGGFNVNTPSVHSAPMQNVSGQVSNDYEKTLQTACKTIDDGINSMAKAMEVADARYVKSQSDEIEMKAVSAINTALYDKDNGYFTKQGKNALDSYKSTSDELIKNVGSLLDNVDPRVREAAQSRLTQRMESAGVSMQRWYASQANQFNVSTSVSRQDMLKKDGAQHYGDKEYWATTMASLYQEVGNQGKFQGWDDETLALKRKAAINDAIIMKYMFFGADSSLNAWVSYQGEKNSLDIAVRERIEQRLKAKYMQDNYGLLKGTDAAQTMDPDKKVDLPGWKALDRHSKKLMLSYAHSEMVQENQIAKSEIGRDIRNRESHAFNTGYFEPYSPNDFSMYGSQASVACDKANAQLRYAAATNKIQGMTLAGAIEFAEQFKPVDGSATNAEDMQYYVSLRKIISNTFSDYKKDGIGKALQVGAFGFRPLTGDILQDNPVSKDKEELKYRIASAKEFQKQYGLEQPVLLSNAEMDGLVGLLGKQETFTEQAAILRKYADVLGDQGIQILASQMKPRNAVYAYAMAKINDATEGENGATVGTKILEGNYYLNIKKTVNLEKDVKDDIKNTFGVVDDPSAVFPTQSALNAETEAAMCVYAYEKGRGRSINAEDAVRKVVGNIGEINGKRVILSEGMDADDTHDFVLKYIGEFKAKPDQKIFPIFNLKDKECRFSKEEVLSQSSNFVLETYDKSNGKASYRIRTNKGYLANSDGTMMIIEVPTLNQMRVNANVIEDKGITDSFDYGYGTDIN